MAMLAEPKRRQQSFALQPRGKPLYEDSNNFGSKMLSKMGWEPGKGLGANEDGKLDFIKVKYKNDIQGIGFEARDDQWTQHEDGFNKLLQTLSNSNSQQNSDDDELIRPVLGFATAESDSVKVKYKPSGESLEQKSKTSRARVHYKKFTRGKDLSQYSEKDLANIFGKKILSNEEVVPQTFPPPEESTPVEDTFVSSIFTTTSALSLSDYFEMKMKNKNQGETNGTEGEPGEEKPKKKKKKKNKDVDQTEVEVIEEKVEEEIVEKKKKKKKQKKQEEEAPIIVENEQHIKKKKRKEKVEETIEEPEPVVEVQIDESVKKSKKRKHRDLEADEVVVKKKKKTKSSDPEESSPINVLPNSLKQSELEFNRIRAEQILSYFHNCQRMIAQTTITIHPVTAEVIRNANISAFKNSNISHIIGYGLTQDVGIDVHKDVKVNLGQMLKETVTAENPHLLIF